MMMNLFSTFDPCTGTLSINWLSSILFMLMMPNMYWKIMNNQMFIMNKTLKKIIKEISMNSKYKSIKLMMILMLTFILLNNLMGLLPYIFTATSHLTLSLSIYLPMWTSYMMYGWTMINKIMLANLLSKNSPVIIMPFMIIIELISNMIRPITLSVRLSANMIAGHLLFTLMGYNKIIIMMMIFEMAVSIIQSYMFMTLMSLHSSEV